jgi:FdhE protein
MQLENPQDKQAQSLSMALDICLQKRPALETVIRPFGAVLVKRASVIEEIKDLLAPFELPHDPERFSAGVPVVAELSLSDWRRPLQAASSALLPALKHAFPNLQTDLSAIEISMRQEACDPGRLGEACMAGDPEAFQAAAKNAGNAPPGTLAFVIHWALATVLNAARIQWIQSAQEVYWSKGECPFCGSLPALASLSRPEPSAGEILRDSGGKRYLYCAWCGHQWRYARHRCPACDSHEKEDLLYYQTPGETAERIDVCRKCGHYLLCIDLRQGDPPTSMDLTAVGMVHLDILAQDKGYSPMTRTLWNRIDEHPLAPAGAIA